MDYKPDNRALVLAAALVVGGSLFVTGQAHAVIALPAVTLEPSATAYNVGDTVSVEVLFHGAGKQLGGFDFDLSYNGSILDFTGYTLGHSLGDSSTADAWDLSSGLTSPGVINIAEVSFLPDLSFQSGALTLATLTFEALYPGDSEFTLHYMLFSDDSAAAIEVPFIGSASVQVVPVPSAGLLMLTALIGLASFRRGRAY